MGGVRVVPGWKEAIHFLALSRLQGLNGMILQLVSTNVLMHGMFRRCQASSLSPPPLRRLHGPVARVAGGVRDPHGVGDGRATEVWPVPTPRLHVPLRQPRVHRAVTPANVSVQGVLRRGQGGRGARVLGAHANHHGSAVRVD